jgi:hypothetical protein
MKGLHSDLLDVGANSFQMVARGVDFNLSVLALPQELCYPQKLGGVPVDEGRKGD